MLVIGSFCRYSLSFYEYKRYDTFGQCFIALISVLMQSLKPMLLIDREFKFGRPCFFSSLSYLLTSFRHDSSIALVNKSRLTLIHVIHLSKLGPKNPNNEIPNDHLEGKSPTCPWVEELDIDRSSHVFCQICCFNEIHFLRTH